MRTAMNIIFALVALLPAASAAYPAKLSDLADRRLGNCHDCSCFSCTSATYNAATDKIDIQIDHCKSGSISWICCVGADGAENNCDMTTCQGSQEGAKCNTVDDSDGVLVSVDKGATYVSINTHDGQTEGTDDMNNNVCGGNGNQGGGCAKNGYTAHCEIDFNLVDDCGYAGGTPSTDPPATDPPATDPPATDPPATDPPSPPVASGSGDPHFKTWTGDKFDYHGECDLVLVDHPNFMDGLGLKLHVRTTRVKYFSFIEKVALQIGDDVLEFDNDVDNFLINGEPAAENLKHHKTYLGQFWIRRDPKALSVRLDHELLGHRAKIDFHTRKNGFPAVIVDAGESDLFKGSLGLLGDFETGKRLARDGTTELSGHDATPFALEWQVRDTDGMIFKEARFPQFPNTCTPPAPKPAGRLGDMMEYEAEKACAHWKEDKEDCIFDVIATRDVLVAEEGHIVHVQ